MGQALATVLEIQDADTRAIALIDLIPHLPDELRDEAIQQALTAIRANPDENEQVRILTGNPQGFPGAPEVGGIGYIDYHVTRSKNRHGLIEYLPDELKAEALEIVLSIQDDGVQIEALVDLAPHLPEALIGRTLSAALSLIQTIVDEEMRANALTQLSPNLPDELIQNALSVVKGIKGGITRSHALTALLPRLPQSLLGESLGIASMVNDQASRSGLLEHMIPMLTNMAGTDWQAVRKAWCEALHALARYPRSDFLHDLQILYPLLACLLPEKAGQEVSTSIFHSLQEICSWWP
jgi:hypothetical protein